MSGYAATVWMPAVLGAQRKKWEKEHPNIPADVLVRWTRWESLCRKYRVDFSEHESNVIERLQVAKDRIIHEGVEFKLIDSFSRLPSGRVDI